MVSALFQKNSRAVRITAWALAGAAAYAWYQHDRKQEREFSQDEAAKWNQEVLARTRTKSEKQRSTEHQQQQ